MLLDSYEKSVGYPLIPRSHDKDFQKEARDLFYATRVVVSHGTQEDPVLCYGNNLALQLWEMDLSVFTATPSRLTAEPINRAERQRLLNEVAIINSS